MFKDDNLGNFKSSISLCKILNENYNLNGMHRVRSSVSTIISDTNERIKELKKWTDYKLNKKLFYNLYILLKKETLNRVCPGNFLQSYIEPNLRTKITNHTRTTIVTLFREFETYLISKNFIGRYKSGSTYVVKD